MAWYTSAELKALTGLTLASGSYSDEDLVALDSRKLPGNNIAETVAGRESTHGSFKSRSITAENILDAMDTTANFNRMEPYQRDALRMVAVKLSRILHGDINHVDSWHDAACYLQMVADELEKENAR